MAAQSGPLSGRRILFFALVKACAILGCLDIFAQTPASLESARRSYESSRSALQKTETNAAAAWKFGRAAYDLADLTDNDSDRAEVAESGIAACRRAIGGFPDSAPAHYYLALNLGQLARGKRFAALRLLREMERELFRALQLDSKFDYGGPDRSLGLLYLEAPSWPVSVGNRRKARTHLQAAVALAPDYPENRICLAEAYVRWGEIQNLEHELNQLADLVPRAQKQFDGQSWEASWKDWQKRIRKLNDDREHLSSNTRPSASERGAKSMK